MERATINLAPGIEVTVIPREQRWNRYTGRIEPGVRNMNRKTRISVWVKNETVLENFANRTSRPTATWRRLLKAHVLPRLGLDGYGLRWNPHAYCSCPCSPAFDLTGHLGLDGIIDPARIKAANEGGWMSVVSGIVDLSVTIDAERLGVPVVADGTEAEREWRLSALLADPTITGALAVAS